MARRCTGWEDRWRRPARKGVVVADRRRSALEGHHRKVPDPPDPIVTPLAEQPGPAWATMGAMTMTPADLATSR